MASRSNSLSPWTPSLRVLPFTHELFATLQHQAAQPGSPLAFYGVEDVINEQTQGARKVGTETERFLLLKNLLCNPTWKGHSNISIEIWKAFALSLPKDGSEDVDYFGNIPEDLWTTLIWELGRNKEEFDLADRLKFFDFTHPLFSQLTPEELLTVVRAHHQPQDIVFWGDVFTTFSNRKWRDLVIALSEDQLAELFFYDVNESISSPVKKLNPASFNKFNETVHFISESPDLIRSQYEVLWRDQQIDLVTKLKLIARLVNPYVERFEKLVELFGMVYPIVQSFALLNTLKRLNDLNEGLSFGLTLYEEHKTKIDSILKNMSPVFHFDIRVAFKGSPKHFFMDKFEIEHENLQTWLSTKFEEANITDEEMEEYLENAEIAHFFKFMNGIDCDVLVDSEDDSDAESDNDSPQSPHTSFLWKKK